MKLNKKQKVLINLECTLDASEATMFAKGGKHEISVPSKLFEDLEELDGEVDLKISFQIDPVHREQFFFTFNKR